MQNAIETVDLTRRFGSLAAVSGLTMQVPVGSVFALVGANGAGKTTTIKVMMNLLRPTRGAASVLGIASTQLNATLLQRIGYVSENQRLPDHLTAEGLLAYCRPFYPTWDAAFARSLESTLNLPMTKPLRTLSRGTRTKAALLSALAYRPDLLILDEPFSGLDPLVRDELVHALLELANERPWTVFMSSHDIEQVERLCDWVGLLDGGRLLFAEPVASLLRRFRMVEVVGRENVPPAMPAEAAWLFQGTAGRTLRFIDTAHSDADAERRIRTVFGDADVLLSPLSLREIFVVLARQSAGAATPSEVRA
jgi:ABC-2 type transport system ATP-binding protein